MAIVLALTAFPAAAFNLIRDAEIERTLSRMSDPIFQAAAIRPSSVTIYIINDRRLNAFVAGGNNMFLNTGLLIGLDTPEEVIGVIAHETGHMAGGHLARRGMMARSTQGPAMLGLLVGILAGVAGAPEAGLALSQGVLGGIERTFLRYNRGEEASADQAALRYLALANVSAEGLLEVLRQFRGQEVFNVGNTDPYVLTHPLSTERLQLVEEAVANAPPGREVSAETRYWFDRMQAKIEGFLNRPERVLNDYPESDTSETALLARAVALHRLPDPNAALATMERLLAMRPNDPYYLELKGQILHESGRSAAAVPLYRQAVRLAPNEPLLMAGLGRSLLSLDDPRADAEALEVLKNARALDLADASALRDLATAYSRAGDNGMATLATAERFALSGRPEDAVLHARRALALLPEGSPGWLRAQDIMALEKTLE